MAADRTFRPMGPMESQYVARHSIRMYYCVALSCRYLVPSRLAGPANEHKLRSCFENAIAHAVEKHPHLQASVDDEHSRAPKWKRLEFLNLSEHVEWNTSADSLTDALYKLHNTHWPELDRNPGWKTVILPSEDHGSIDVIFAWHHAYGDGKSGAVFQRTLLEGLQAETASPSSDKVLDGRLELPKDSKLPPTVHDLVKFTYTTPSTTKLVWAEHLRPSFLAPRPPEHPAWGGGPITTAQYTTRLRLVEVDGRNIQAAVQQCRVHKTSVTGLLHALVLASLARNVPEEKAKAFSSITAICLRGFASSSDENVDPEDILGNFITRTPHAFGPDDVSRFRVETLGAEDLSNAVWAVAGRVKGEICDKLKMLPANDTVGRSHLVRDWKAWLVEKMNKPREETWGVSNLGVVDRAWQTSKGMTSEWKLERAVFSQNAPVNGPAVVVNVSGVAAGKLCITLTWQEGVLPDEITQLLASDLEKSLVSLGKDGEVEF